MKLNQQSTLGRRTTWTLWLREVWNPHTSSDPWYFSLVVVCQVFAAAVSSSCLLVGCFAFSKSRLCSVRFRSDVCWIFVHLPREASKLWAESAQIVMFSSATSSLNKREPVTVHVHNITLPPSCFTQERVYLFSRTSSSLRTNDDFTSVSHQTLN